MLDLRQAFEALSSGRLIGDGSVRLRAICTDSRQITEGCLFVALRGERFDAHDFARAAREAGAAAVLVERWPAGLTGPALLVPDTRRALGEIAAAWRRRHPVPLVAVTGSNGKTTVKEMIASILEARYGAHGRLATVGNLNNDIGVPVSVLRLADHHQAAVLELGMNRPGEIAWLASIARPDVALVNNAQREHQEFMHSVEATALENGAALAALGPSGVAVFPGDDPHAPIWQGLAGARRCLRFGLDAGCEVRATPGAHSAQFTMSLAGQDVEVRLAIDGAHNVRNALAAAACALALGIDAATIVSGLERFRPVRGRLVRLQTASGANLIDDSYNANPDSVRAAIEVLRALPAPRVLVLGDMGEVGTQGPEFHREVGAYAAECGLEHLLALGEATRDSVAAFGDGGEHFESLDALVTRVRERSPAGASVLVKGSRFMAMERVVAALVPQTGTPEASH